MSSDFKKKILVGDRVFELRWVSGRIRRQGEELACFIDNENDVLELSNLLDADEAVRVIAAAVSYYCQQRWKPIPLVDVESWV